MEVFVMANRVPVNEQELDNIVGGAFKFYTLDNQGFCKVSDVANPGTYKCTAVTGVYTFMQMRSENPGLSGDEYLEMALNQGILWV